MHARLLVTLRKKEPVMSELKGAAKRILGGLQNRLSKLARFGQSKHEAKQAARDAYLKEHGNLEGYNPARVDGIYSIGTMETYRAAMQPFAKWCSAHKVKNAAQITEAHAAAYLREREQAGLSSWTVSRDLSAINKALGFELSKRELGLRQRKKSEITRSREETANEKRQFSKHRDQITLAKACGCRRASVTKITPNDCVRNSRGQVVGIRVVEKGGKERVAPVLNVYKERVTSIVDRAQEASQPLFTAYDSHIDNHRFRAEYCAALLKQLEEEQAQEKPWFGGDLSPQNYIHLSGRDKHCGDTYHGHPTQGWSPPSAGPWAITGWRSFSATITIPIPSNRPLIAGNPGAYCKDADRLPQSFGKEVTHCGPEEKGGQSHQYTGLQN